MAYLTFFAAFALFRVTIRERKEPFNATWTREGSLFAVVLTLFVSRSADPEEEVPACDAGWTVVAGIAGMWARVVVESVADVRPFLEVKHLTARISLKLR